jgi:hypothetical protein
MSRLETIRRRVRMLLGRGGAESRMQDEIGFHLEMEADRLVREEGLDRREARGGRWWRSGASIIR